MAANTTITFDSYDLSDLSTYIPEMSDHQTSPPIDNNVLPTAKSNGAKLVSSWYKEKYVNVSGYIQASSQANLEAKIDEFKEKMSHQDKNLDFTWNGTTRRYVATASEVTIVRGSDNRDWCAFSVTFLVPSGMGKAITAVTTTVSNITTVTSSASPTISGTAPANPIFTFTVNSETTLTNISFAYTNSQGEIDTINFPASYNAADVLVIDFGAFTATLNGTALDYTGTWPVFTPGASSYVITFTSSAHNVSLSYTYYPEYL